MATAADVRFMGFIMVMGFEFKSNFRVLIPLTRNCYKQILNKIHLTLIILTLPMVLKFQVSSSYYYLLVYITTTAVYL